MKVGPCGAGLCATIASPKSTVDPETGRPWTDKYNPDPAQRGRPLVGVPVLYGLVPDGPGRWSGRLYNVDNGNSYAGRLLELGPATIRVEGCAIGICGGRNMTRIRLDALHAQIEAAGNSGLLSPGTSDCAWQVQGLVARLAIRAPITAAPAPARA